MESSYGVGTLNRYALFLDDESDPLDAIKAQEQAKEQKKKSKDAEKENKGNKPEPKPKSSVAAPVRKGIKETQNVKSQDNKNLEPKNKGPARPNERNSERPPPRRRDDRPQNGAVEGKDGAPRPPRREYGDRRPNFERRNNNENADGGERRPPRPRDPRDRDAPRGGPRSFDGRGKREFDRRSGSDKTGVKPVDKREGAGAHNWGTVRDDIDEMNKTSSDGDTTEEKVNEISGSGGGDAQQSETERVPAEEEPRELTLDEYKALRNAQRTAPQYNLRKAGEGEDLSQWKNLVLLETKKEATGDEDDSDDEYDIADYPQRVGRQKRVLGIEFTFNDTARRGGIGGRGRGRGRGGGGAGVRGPRGPREEHPQQDERPSQRQQTAPPKVDDSKDFPSLG